MERKETVIRRIHLSTADKRAIARLFGVTEDMVRMALTYHRDSLTARRIRRMALERGGYEVEIRTTPVEALKL